MRLKTVGKDALRLWSDPCNKVLCIVKCQPREQRSGAVGKLLAAGLIGFAITGNLRGRYFSYGMAGYRSF